MRQFAEDTKPDPVSFVMTDMKGGLYRIETEVGKNLMQEALKVEVPFPVACGGNAECCTCHVYLTKKIILA